MLKGRKILMVVEVQDARNEVESEERLDEFRESVLPSSEWGLTMYRATPKDLTLFNLESDACFVPDVAFEER